MDGKQLTNPEAIRSFITAGRATFTLVSKKTSTRFTYKFSSPRFDRYSERSDARLWTSVLTGCDNESSYTYVGHVVNSSLDWRMSPKSPMSSEAPAIKALHWFLHTLRSNNAQKLEQLEVWHEGRCGRCNRKLTVPESVASGFGPECANRR